MNEELDKLRDRALKCERVIEESVRTQNAFLWLGAMQELGKIEVELALLLGAMTAHLQAMQPGGMVQ